MSNDWHVLKGAMEVQWRQSTTIWDVKYRGVQFQVVRRASGRFSPVVNGGERFAFETFMAPVGVGWVLRSTPKGIPRASTADQSVREVVQQALRVSRDTEWGSPGRVAVTEVPRPDPDPWTAQDVALAMVRHAWPRVMAEAKARKRILHAFLMETWPLEVDCARLVIAVFYRFHLENLQNVQNHRQVEAILRDVTGAPWRVSFALRPQ